MKSRGSQAALTVIFVIFGFMLATQFRARPPLSSNYRLQRAEELAVLLQVTEEERDRLKDEVASLRDKVAEMMAGEDQVELLREELQKARILAGLTEVKGPGVVLEMTDSQKPPAPGQDPNLLIIHDDDVAEVVNELFGAGAEAVSVNGQRLISTSEIRCAGNVIMINGARIAPPIIVLAIGDPETLMGGLKFPGGVVDSLSLWGIEVKVKAADEVIVPAYNGSLVFRYAQPTRKGEAG
ncbi:MAG: DUF881 domain-containing protein [Bacillota bacterium]|jgi:uncharacterized protein YlxW (UPF0749 family)